MTLLKGAEVERYLAAPSSARPVLLLFGPDAGAVSERASKFATQMSGGDEMAIMRFDEAELASEPDRLANEVYAGSLFSGVRIVRIKAGGNRSISGALGPIIHKPPPDTWIVIEAGDLRKTAPLRKLCESAPGAAAIGCYPDNEAALGRLIDAEFAGIGASIEPDARTALVALLGADRAASRSEIQKLCLYVGPGGVATGEDVATMIGDGGAMAIDDIVDAAALGNQSKLDRTIRRAIASGTAISTVGIAVERHFLQLHALKASIAAGKPAATAIQGLRPPVFPSRRRILESQLRIWTLGSLAKALERINEAMIVSRLQPAVSQATIGRLLAGLAARAAHSGRNSRD